MEEFWELLPHDRGATNGLTFFDLFSISWEHLVHGQRFLSPNYHSLPYVITTSLHCYTKSSSPGYKYSARLYDVLLGGFANAGQLGKVQYYEAMMRRERIRLSARGFSLVIKGFLKNGFVKEAMV